MKKTALLLLTAAALAAVAQDGGLVAKPEKYQYRHIATFKEETPVGYAWFNAKKDETGCEISYKVTGGNIKGIDTDSLTVTSATTEDGKDLLAADKDGWGPSWKPTGGVSTGDGHAGFSVFITTAPSFLLPGNRRKINVKGTINARVATQTETETLTFKTHEKGKEQTASPLTFSISDDKRFGRQFGLLVKGGNHLISKVSVTAGGQKAESNSSTTVDNQTILHFGSGYGFEPATPEFTLTVSYFTDMKDVPVTIGE